MSLVRDTTIETARSWERSTWLGADTAGRRTLGISLGVLGHGCQTTSSVSIWGIRGQPRSHRIRSSLCAPSLTRLESGSQRALLTLESEPDGGGRTSTCSKRYADSLPTPARYFIMYIFPAGWHHSLPAFGDAPSATDS